jgi:protein-tyrosine kinase
MSKIHEALEKAARERETQSPTIHKPPAPQNGGAEKGGPRERENEAPPARPTAWPRDGGVKDPHLVAFFQPHSLAAEQFRKLRTKLLRLRLPQPPRTILVTSSAAGEGKTLVATNLAAGIAHDLQAHALLVDCDFRNPSLSQWFGLKHGKGLSDYLVGDIGIPNLLVKTGVDKLTILPCGSMQENPTELMGSKKMEALVQELKSRYNDRYVIIDSTPVLATSEPEVLSRLVDGILVVVRAGLTPRETVKQAISSLENEKILGFVLNDLQFKSSGLNSRYFGSDDSHYRYGYGKSQEKARRG